MSDYTSEGAVPVEDGVVDDPPTVDDVLEEQRRLYPHQFETNRSAGGHLPDRNEAP